MQLVLGTKLWDGWFDFIPLPVPDEEIVPRQALTFVSMALERVKNKYDAIEATKAAAAESYAAMTAEARAKKRRVAEASA